MQRILQEKTFFEHFFAETIAAVIRAFLRKRGGLLERDWKKWHPSLFLSKYIPDEESMVKLLFKFERIDKVIWLYLLTPQS